MAKLNAHDRQKKIISLLSANGTMKITDLANHFNVSRETIRRDLITLKKKGAVKKWFGSVTPVHDYEIQAITKRMTKNYDKKIKICEKALTLIPKNSVIYIDSGSTSLCMAKFFKNKSGYTIITNSIPVITELCETPNQIIVVGGTVNSRVMSIMGFQASNFLESIKPEVAILGTDGFATHKGPSVNNLDDGGIKRIIINNSFQTIVVTDSSKAEFSALAQYAPWQDIDYVITDSDISTDKLKEIEKYTTVILSD